MQLQRSRLSDLPPVTGATGGSAMLSSFIRLLNVRYWHLATSRFAAMRSAIVSGADIRAPVAIRQERNATDAALPEGDVEGEAEALVLASHLRFFGAGVVRSALTHPMVMGPA
jgi:hypothetical protein